MNINKHFEFFDPSTIEASIHVIGCGAIGSTLLEMLARLGIDKITIYDFDTVEPANVANQMYYQHHTGRTKTDAIKEILEQINPAIQLDIQGAYERQRLSGYVFLCVDDIELRHRITQEQLHNPYIKAMFDFRMRLTDAQHYAADWSIPEQRENFLGTMAFTKAEAKAATPVSACGTTLSIAPTVRVITAFGVSNFLNLLAKREVKAAVICDAFNYNVFTL